MEGGRHSRLDAVLANEWELTFLKSEGYLPKNEWGQAKVLPYKRRPKEKSLEQEIYEQKEMQNDEN